MIKDLKRQWKTAKRRDTFSHFKPLAMRDFTKYNVWVEAIELAVEVYRLTSSFLDSEKFGLVSQLRRAVVSFSSNIAEGTSRSSEFEFCRFIEISIGSGFEIKSQIVLSYKLGFINEIKLPSLQ